MCEHLKVAVRPKVTLGTGEELLNHYLAVSDDSWVKAEPVRDGWCCVVVVVVKLW